MTKYAILLTLSLLLAGCNIVVVPVPVDIDAAVAAVAATPAPAQAVAPSPVSGAVNDPAVLAQLEALRAACDSSMTGIQQERALDEVRPFFSGREVQITGTINDVREATSGFDAIIAMDKLSRDILVVDLTEEQALSLNKGDAVLLTGTLEATACGFYVKLKGTIESR